MRSTKSPILLFVISFFLMLAADHDSLMYLPVLATLVSVILFGSEKTFIAFICVMFFSYPLVNAICILIIALGFFVSKRTIKIVDQRITGIVLLLTGWTFVDSLFTRIPGSSWNDCLSWLYVLVVIIIVQSVGRSRLFEVLRSIQLAGVILAVIQTAAAITPQLGGILTNAGAIRIPATNIGSTIHISCILLAELPDERVNKTRIAGYLKIGLHIFCIFVLGSRGIMALLLAYFILRFFLTGNRNTRGLQRKFLIAVFVIVGVLFFLQTKKAAMIIRDLQSITSATYKPNNIRIHLYQDIITKIIPQNMLVGVGPGNFSLVYSQYASISFNARHAHNIYLQLFSESGILGLVLVFLLTAELIIRTFKGLFDRKITMIRMCAYINLFYFAYGLVEYTWNDSRSMILFFLINVICYMHITNKGSSLDRPQHHNVKDRTDKGNYI